MLKLFSGVQGEYHRKLGDDHQKADVFGLIKLIKKSSPLSILCRIIYKKMKRSCQEDLEVLEKLNHRGQVLVLSLESLENQTGSDQTGRLTGLLKFTGGEAKELIKHCIQLPPKTGYETAVRMLNNRYGNCHYLLASYRKEIKALPSVKPGDASGFRKFYSFVLKCETFSKSAAWNALETLERLCILVSMLSGSLRNRWNRKVQVVGRNIGREPCLSDFSCFVHEEKKHDKKRNIEVLPQKREKW